MRPCLRRVEELEWQGPTECFAQLSAQFGDARLLGRVHKARMSAENKDK
jgi:hypothetical protein